MESKDLGIENEFPVLNFAPKAYFKKKSQDDPGWRVNQVWLMAGGECVVTRSSQSYLQELEGSGSVVARICTFQ